MISSATDAATPRGIGGSKHFAVMSGVAAVVGCCCCCAVDTQDEVEEQVGQARGSPARARQRE
jgi:hypothetical protein